jgi:hypothetical protein
VYASFVTGRRIAVAKMNGKSTISLRDALDVESLDWLTVHAPRLLDAVEWEIANGRTPVELRRLVQQNIGPERAGLGLRIEQAARAILYARGQG